MIQCRVCGIPRQRFYAFPHSLRSTSQRKGLHARLPGSPNGLSHLFVSLEDTDSRHGHTGRHPQQHALRQRLQPGTTTPVCHHHIVHKKNGESVEERGLVKQNRGHGKQLHTRQRLPIPAAEIAEITGKDGHREQQREVIPSRPKRLVCHDRHQQQRGKQQKIRPSLAAKQTVQQIHGRQKRDKHDTGHSHVHRIGHPSVEQIKQLTRQPPTHKAALVVNHPVAQAPIRIRWRITYHPTHNHKQVRGKQKQKNSAKYHQRLPFTGRNNSFKHCPTTCFWLQFITHRHPSPQTVHDHSRSALSNANGMEMKNVEPTSHSFHSVKAFALPCQSKRATPKAPRQCMYILPPSSLSHLDTEAMGTHIVHLKGRSRCFVFDRQLRVCEVLTLSIPKRTVTPI